MSDTSPYPHLFSPLEVGRVTVRNRVVMSPMGDRLAIDGAPTSAGARFFARRARGGVGLVITGGTLVHPTSASVVHRLYEAYRPLAQEGFAQVAAAVHAEGAKIFGQLLHIGREVGDPEVVAWGPSAIAPMGSNAGSAAPHAMSKAEIAEVVASFARCAENLVAAGFDGVEIHAAHGYMAWQFLSPLSNIRVDEYGGPVGRPRFLLEVVDAIRESIGPQPALGVRLCTAEEMPGGLVTDDIVLIAETLSRTGQVDYLNTNVGSRGFKGYVKDMGFAPGFNAEEVGRITRAVDIPVIYAQRVTMPEVAESILANGHANLVALARALVADPNWAQKASLGQRDSIIPCVGCVQDCRTLVQPRCANNPLTGREDIWPEPRTIPAVRLRRIAVIGAGPAGLEAAVVAATRGHSVRLYESRPALGGQVRIAAGSPFRADLQGVISYREQALQSLGVDVITSVTADARLLAEAGVDAVVVATGATQLAGAPLTDGSVPTMQAWDLLESPPARPEGVERPRALVIDRDGDWNAVSSAETLAAAGWEPTIVTAAGSFGARIPWESLTGVRDRLAASEIRVIANGRLERIDSGRGHLTLGWMDFDEPFDLLVVDGGTVTNHSLYDELVSDGGEAYLVGDSVAPRRMSEAIVEGHRVAREL